MKYLPFDVEQPTINQRVCHCSFTPIALRITNTCVMLCLYKKQMKLKMRRRPGWLNELGSWVT